LISLFLAPLAFGYPVRIGTIQTTHEQIAGSTVFSDLEELVPSPIREITIPQNNSDPLAITIDSTGLVWFAETSPASIANYNPITQAFKIFPIPTSSDCGLIWFLVIDGTYLWFSCGNLPLLWSFSLTTFLFANFSTGNPDVVPFSLTLDSRSNQIWFTSIYTDQIGAFSVDSMGTATLARIVNLTEPSIVSSAIGPKYGPSGIAIDSSGNLFLTETFAGSIAEYNQSANDFVEYWKLQTGAQPVGIVVNDSAGRIWFTNHGSSQFGTVDVKTGAIYYFTTSLYGYNYSGSSVANVETLPYWIQQSPNGAIWLDEHVGNKIVRFDSRTDEITEFIIPTVNSSPLRFALDNRSGIVWFTEFQGNKIGILDENQTCDCSVSVSPSQTVLSGQTTNLIFNFIDSDFSNFSQSVPLISGSFSNVGNITSNLTLSYRSINSTAYQILLHRGRDLTAGNYSLTLCTNSNSQVRQCAVALLSIPYIATPSTSNYLAIVIVAGLLVAVSLAYVARWRKRKS